MGLTFDDLNKNIQFDLNSQINILKDEVNKNSKELNEYINKLKV
jgi:hypothetical protein